MFKQKPGGSQFTLQSYSGGLTYVRYHGEVLARGPEVKVWTVPTRGALSHLGDVSRLQQILLGNSDMQYAGAGHIKVSKTQSWPQEGSRSAHPRVHGARSGEVEALIETHPEHPPHGHVGRSGSPS